MFQYPIPNFLLDNNSLVRPYMVSTNESEIQEVNPPKTVAPPLQTQPLNEERHIQKRMVTYINTISLIRAILEFHPHCGDIAKKLVKNCILSKI